eukprot:scpid26415/ scgid13116/ Translation initiation factor IF-2
MSALYSSGPLRAILQRSASIACRPVCSSTVACAHSPRHALKTSMLPSPGGSLYRVAAAPTRNCVLHWRSSSTSSASGEGSIIFLPSRDITIADLASRLPNTSAGNVMVLASELGVTVDRGPETMMPQDIAEFVATEMGFIPQMDIVNESAVTDSEKDLSKWCPRPPVVTIMGHVDHGKTTLLDFLRKTSVAAGEAGGITQHIGAFQVKLPNTSGTVTFLDTPGHAAFTAMRSRGALATDIVVLVVAADDGVMPQTVESIRLAQRAQVPIVVAVNKCDLHNANPLEAKSGLLNQGIQLEEFGGEVVGVEISALQGDNIDELQEAILVTADLTNLKADFKAPASGLILETKTKHGLGMVATALVKSGTLKVGQSVMAGLSVARVRMMHDHNEKQVKTATPSMPVQIVGWKTTPHPGDTFRVVASEKEALDEIQEKCKVAREKASKAANTQALREKRAHLRKMVVDLQEKKKEIDEKYKDREKHRQLDKAYRHELYVAQQASLREKKETAVDGAGTPELCVILKGDVQGSIDAMQVLIGKFQDERAKLSVIHTGIGNVTPGDIQMAKLTKGKIYCLHTDCDRNSKKMAEKENVSVFASQVIYKLMDTMKEHIESIVEGEKETISVGSARVQAIFNITGLVKRHVAGCMVTSGRLCKDYKIRVYRNKEEVHHGRLSSIRQEKDEVTSINMNAECGLSVTDQTFEFEEGDRIESYDVIEKKTPVHWMF